MNGDRTSVYPTLREALGGSVIREELKGDFAGAADIARCSVAAADRSGDRARRTDARIDLALVQILQGLPGAALETLDSLTRPEALAPDPRARRASLRHLAVHLRFNTFPGGEGAGGAHLASLWDGPSYGAEEQARWQNVPLAECDRVIALEARLLHDTLCNLKSSRTFVVPGPWMTESTREHYFRLAMQIPLRLVQSRARDPSDPVAGFGFFAAADLCRRARDPEAAQKFLDHARRRYEELGDWSGLAICWALLGDQRAAPFTTPIYLNLPVEDVRDVSSAVSDELLEMAGAAPAAQVAAARTAYEQARTCFSNSQAQRGLGSIELRQAYLEDLCSDPETAVTLAQRAAERFFSVDDQLNAHLARTHALLYRIHRYPFEWDPDTARDVGEWGKNDGSVSWALGLGLLLTASGRHWIHERADADRSLTCYRHAQALYEALGADVNAAQCLVDRAEVHRTMAETDACISLSLQGLNRYLDCTKGHPSIQPDLQHRSIRLLESLYWLYAGTIDAEGMERSANRLRRCLEELSAADSSIRGESATEPSIESIVVQQARSALTQSTVMIPLYRGKALAEQGRPEEARPHLEIALDAAAAVESEDCHRLEALVRGTMGDFAGAARAFERRFERGTIPVDEVVAQALATIRSTSPDTAREMERKLELKEHLNAVYFLVQMEAFEAADRHLKLVEARIGPDWWRSEARPWESLMRRAELRAGLADFEGALEDIDRCVELLDAARVRLPRDTQRTALSGSALVRHVYSLGIRSAHRLMESQPELRGQWLDRTYRYAEQGKSRALLDLLASAETGDLAEAGASWVHTWREINAYLSTWYALIAEEQARDAPRVTRLRDLMERQRKDEERLQVLTDSIANENPRFYTMVRAPSEVISTAEMAEHLPRGSLLLQYHFAGNDFFGWAIDCSGRVDLHYAAHDSREVGLKIREFHGACSSGGDWMTPGNQLSRIFLAPFAKRLESFEHVVVVPFSHGHRLPFHALPWTDGPFSQTHSLSFLPSGSVARYLRRSERTGPGPVLAVGDPADMALSSAPSTQARSLSRLPAAALEARYVASLHAGSRAMVAEEATVDAVRTALSGYRLLHFATHGVLNERAPLSSAVVLANGESLTAADFLGIGLDADLVVLSGCRTGLGDVTAGDEVVGLTRALLASGAKATVVSLWPVRDAATSYFMRHFYELLPTMGPALALQSAQAFLRQLNPEQQELEQDRLIEAVANAKGLGPTNPPNAVRDLRAAEAVPGNLSFSHPYYWAPFIYVGAA